VPQRKDFKVAILTMAALLFANGPACLAADSPEEGASVAGSAAQDYDADKKDIEKILSGFQNDWNAHNLESVMSYYADDYISNDGFDKATIQKLTEELWKTYPDIKSSSVTKQIRVEGPYATIASRDEATGNTATEFPGLACKGEMKSQAEGQLYMKHVGTRWRITGDRTDYEKIRINYGQGRQLEPTFAAPEQVKAGKQFSAKLEVELPAGLGATGAISQQLAVYPSAKIHDKFKQLGDPLTDRPLLERVMTANTKGHNELLMSIIALTNASGNAIVGVVLLTRRVNVVPAPEDEGKVDTARTAPAADSKTDSEAAPGGVR
jgi:hypothetical protein